MATNWWAIIQGGGTVTASNAIVFTNKSYDADATGNVLSNVDDGNIKAAANIAKSKISTTGTWVAADIPSLDASKITAGTIATAREGSGTANSTTFLRGDQTWATPSGGGSVDYTIPATAMANVVKIGSTITAYEADGTVISTGTNAATVINAAIAFLPTEVWSLNIMSGTYTITASIDFTGKKKGQCNWGGVYFLANISDAAAYVVHMGLGAAQNIFSGMLMIDLATNDKKFGLCIMEDSGSNIFENLRIWGHGTNKATVGIKIGGVGVGLANDDNEFRAVEVHHCTVGIQLGETTNGTNVYHNTFHHINCYGTLTMVQCYSNAIINEFKSMGLETGTRFISCSGVYNIFECVYASGGSPVIGDFTGGADSNVVKLGQYILQDPLLVPTDTSTAKTTSVIPMGRPTIAVSTITPGASPYAYVNADLYAEDVTVGGGTVSAISFIRNGGATFTTGLTSGVFRLDPRDELRVTYSSVPTMRKIPR